MSALVLVLGVLLGLGVAGFALLPLVRDSDAGGSESDARADDLRSRRDRVYGEIRDLDFDLRVGKITAEDHREGKERLELEAARILQALDERVRLVDEQIEKDVRALRQERPACPSCGAAIPPEARFCASCGAGLTAASRR